MKNKIKNTMLLSALVSCSLITSHVLASDNTAKKQLSPGEIVKQAPAEHWQAIDPNNTLYIELDSGRVIVVHRFYSIYFRVFQPTNFKDFYTIDCFRVLHYV
ncbi:hypothetical protein ACMAZF_11460 [Psychrobium sp. nBUS_13]|uniref:hypothetical protein n=1 Tax=Psychrobium sp. nBUS_13 TaxID=3395319 RepID=UPI003EBD5B84